METKKVKHPSIDFTILKIGLRILANCCSCIEGRLLIGKVRKYIMYRFLYLLSKYKVF